MSNKILCIYHANCADGIGAAWVLKERISKLVDITYFPANYGDNPPNVGDFDNVYILDFSYPRDTIIKMSKEVQSITVIDHHATAENNLKDLPNNVKTVFDMNHSGAMLTWKYFPKKITPKILEYIEDRDLWRFKFDNTNPIMAAFFSYGISLDTMDRFAHVGASELLNLIREGKAILRDRDMHNDWLMGN